MINQSKCPEGHIKHVFKTSWALNPKKSKTTWETLQRRETFVAPQIFPYRVEFEGDKKTGTFSPGEKNIHHGPLLSVHGEIGPMSDNYRALYYYYGSYVLSFRLARPISLEFELEGHVLKLTLTSYIRKPFLPLWNLGLKIFWKFSGITFIF